MGDDMELTSNKSDEFISYPTNRVVGTIDDAGAAQAVVETLLETGFDTEGIEVLYGEEGMRRLDPTGEEHGLLARFQRAAVQWNEEDKYLRQHVKDIRAGHFVIMVLAKEPEKREKVREILKSHGGHFIKFFGNWAIRSLDTGNSMPVAPAEYESYLPDIGHIYEVHLDGAVLNVRSDVNHRNQTGRADDFLAGGEQDDGGPRRRFRERDCLCKHHSIRRGFSSDEGNIEKAAMTGLAHPPPSPLP
jgi:hypothetical protein